MSSSGIKFDKATQLSQTRQCETVIPEGKMFAAITEYNESIGCGGRDGEIEKPEQNGAILINGCLLAEHLRKRFVLDRDVDSTCTIHHDLLTPSPAPLACPRGKMFELKIVRTNLLTLWSSVHLFRKRPRRIYFSVS